MASPAGNPSNKRRLPCTLLMKAKIRRKQQRRRERREIERRMEKVSDGMREIGEEQRKIREGQREVRLKSAALASECRRLRQQTDDILKQSAVTQQRLVIMFSIIRARDNNDSDTANELVLRLREMIPSNKRSL